MTISKLKRIDKRTILLLSFLLLAGSLELIQYLVYYNQEVQTSFVWVLVDWSIWGFLFFSLPKLERPTSKIVSKRLADALLVALFPLVHILITSSVFYLIYGNNEPVLVDLLHRVSKRYFQYLMISALGYGIHYISSKKETKQSANLEETALCFEDGVNKFFIKPVDINCVTSAKNYVVIDTDEKQFLYRSTLSQISEKLSQYGFIRVNRSTLVNKNHLNLLDKPNKNSFRVTLKSGKTFKVGPTYMNQVRESL